mmetsp:Transcript_33691/g.86311  ORF Transcript_33691/g.86311 Transcript_33691/m.86311 type:complete len:203 (+) Transcript_33691:953-1561(+)
MWGLTLSRRERGSAYTPRETCPSRSSAASASSLCSTARHPWSSQGCFITVSLWSLTRSAPPWTPTRAFGGCPLSSHAPSSLACPQASFAAFTPCRESFTSWQRTSSSRPPFATCTPPSAPLTSEPSSAGSAPHSSPAPFPSTSSGSSAPWGLCWPLAPSRTRSSGCARLTRTSRGPSRCPSAHTSRPRGSSSPSRRPSSSPS